MCPDKSTRPVIIQRGNDYIAHWKQKKGKKVWAVWSTSKLHSFVNVEGKAKYFDLYGKELSKLPEMSESIMYIVGAKDVTF